MSSSLLKASVAETIRQLRAEKGVSQEELASQCGLDRTYISGIERKTRNPTIETLEKIIAAFGLSEKEFLLKVCDNFGLKGAGDA